MVDALSFYIVYMSHHIQPQSVKSYLSSICTELECFSPDIHEIQSSHLVSQTLAGCIKLLGHPANQKCALSEQDLHTIRLSFPPSPSHNDLLFLAITYTGWHCLMCLGELVCPDARALCDNHKNISHHSVSFSSQPRPHISFFLPMHKADCLWEGSTIVLEHCPGPLDPIPILSSYLASRDAAFPHLPDLWLNEASNIPSCSWFISKLHSIIPSNEVAGHSLHASGTTALALAGMPLEHIQMIGHWSSQVFLIYLQQNPILLHGSISSR